MAYVVGTKAALGEDSLAGGTQVNVSQSADVIVTFDKIFTGPITEERTYSMAAAAGTFNIETIKAGLASGEIISNVTRDVPAEGIETISWTVQKRIFA